MSPLNNLEWLQERAKDYSHKDFIRIETVDNPGWYGTINLAKTKYEDFSFKPIKFDESDYNWYFCLKRNNNFEASCSSTNLEIILGKFRSWIEAC